MTTAVSTVPEAAAILYKRLGFEPTGPEQEAVLACRKRFFGLSGGEGAGKSVIASKVWLGRWPDDMASNPGVGDGKGPPLIYWLVGEDYSQVTEEYNFIYQDLVDLGLPIEKNSTMRVDPGHIELRLPDERQARFRLETKSASDPTKLTRQRPHGVIHCEPGQSHVAVYERLNGRIAGVRGWLGLIGTLESYGSSSGSIGWYPQLLQAWSGGYGECQSFALPSWTNTYYYPGGRQDPEILRLERDSTDTYFMERIAGQVVPPKGLVIPEFRADLHVQDVVYDPNYPVHLWEDPGYGSHSAHALVVVQHIDRQLRVVDEIYERSLTTQDIIRIAQSRPWWKGEKRLVGDPHYVDQHHSTHSVSDIWRIEAGLEVQGERVRQGPGRERLRTYFKPDPLTGRPGIVISPSIKGLLSELGAALDPFDNRSFHPWKWKEDRTGTIVGVEPLDEYNHSCKALIYGIVYNFGYAHSDERRVARVLRRNGVAQDKYDTQDGRFPR